MISTQLPFNALTSALEGFARAKQISVWTSQHEMTRAPMVHAKKGSYEFYLTMPMFISVDEFFGDVAHLFYELDQYDQGLWITEDGKDQYQFNFNLIRIMEEHKDEIIKGTYPIQMQRL
jgi:hypothetical protein